MADNATCCGLLRPDVELLPLGDLVPVSQEDGLRFKNADIYTPTGDRLLLRNINLHIKKGESCLIMGPSGIGKSSLLRVLGKLWPLFKSPAPRRNFTDMSFASGSRAGASRQTSRRSITGPSRQGTNHSLSRTISRQGTNAEEVELPELGRPQTRSLFMLAQRPYMIDGTLREQV